MTRSQTERHTMERKHWFIRFLPLWVLMAMVAIPATSIWTGKLIESRNRAEQAEGFRQLFLTGKVGDINAQLDAQLDALLEDIGQGNSPRIPEEWRQARDNSSKDEIKYIETPYGVVELRRGEVILRAPLNEADEGGVIR